ncbi:MAG: DUF3501 family protein [Acidimicrobiales bacterium]|nr:DUF3501 family protein [Acidimicrobiales bacterium]
MPKLTLNDIADLRAYERERDEFRAQVIALKKRRRVPVGDKISFVFENRDTIRFQIQEMARVEKLMSDEAIETELRIYNPLIPEPGHLAATMFIELVTDEELREWLPKLVGIETEVELRIGAGENGEVTRDTEVVRCLVDPDHAKQLTREDVTASVHYIHFALSPEQIERFATERVALAITHPDYQHATVLGEETRAELLNDLRYGG